MVFVAYTQTNNGAATHITRWIADAVNRPGAWTFDDSNSNGATNAALPALTINAFTKTAGDATCSGAGCDFNVTVTVPVPGGVYGDLSINPRSNIVAGAEIRYARAAVATPPTTGEEASWTAITTDPTNDQWVPYSGFGVQRVLTLTGITGTTPVFFSYRPVMQYNAACAVPATCTAGELSALGAAGFSLGYFTANSIPIDPTPTTFSSFTAAYASLQSVNLAWVTASETDAMGFNLYRSLDGANWTKVNGALIPATGTGGAGASYAYTDNLPKQRVYQAWKYKVEEMSNTGTRIAETTTETTK